MHFSWQFSVIVVGLVLAGGVLPSAGQSAGQPAPPPSPLVDLVLSVRERMRLEAQAQRARERLKVLAREGDAIVAQQKTLLGELGKLELDRQRHAAEEQAARTAAMLARSALAETTNRIEALEAAAAARAPVIRARLHRLYALGPVDSARYWVRTNSLVQTARGWRLLAAVASRDRELLAEAARDRAEMKKLGAAQSSQAADAERLAQTARNARTATMRSLAARRALLTRLDEERDLSARLVGELQQADDRLRALLATPPGGAAKAADADQSVILPLAPFKGDLDWPVTGQLLMRFGRERQSRFGTVLQRNGIEIGAAESAPVQVVHEGRVVFADHFAGLGRLVIIEHGGSAFSLYGHLGEISVNRGDALARGSRVGTVGQTLAGAQAIYFELRIDGQPVDPLEWMKPSVAAPARR